MVEEGKTLIEIDLNQFKLHIRVQNGMELSLHFNSPSRKFYLSVIALVVNEMKKLEKVTSIPLESHYDTLALLNETWRTSRLIRQEELASEDLPKMEGCPP